MHTPPDPAGPLLRLVRLARRPLDRFLAIQAASGVLLLVAAAVAMALANSPFAGAYARLWETPLGLSVGDLAFLRPLSWFVNDGLMAIFFFVVGMEIRREIHHGELSEWRRAALPAAAALGGMVAPAALYLAFAGAPETRAGWGVPMATDIAFAVGVLALLGRRVPPALRVLLLALAVIDDLGAIIVIAVFYSGGLNPVGFAVAGGGLLAIVAMRSLGVRHPSAYVLPAVVAWAGTYSAGIHPTIAGVIVGLMTPVQGPAESLIARLHPWVAFGIMPVFALANAGVPLEGMSLEGAAGSVAAGCAVGLVVGKPVGILAACGAALASGLARLPVGIGARHLVVLGVVAGIGFTMSLFIAQLAFASPALLGAAKLGVLAGTGVAGVAGVGLGLVLLRPLTSAGPDGPGPARTADEAEGSAEV